MANSFLLYSKNTLRLKIDRQLFCNRDQFGMMVYDLSAAWIDIEIESPKKAPVITGLRNDRLIDHEWWNELDMIVRADNEVNACHAFSDDLIFLGTEMR